ncbi:MAG: NAD(P)-dependent dehydrogenase (short-subunit alcohol dehydrogenase family) [Paracoccaceae bacterium]|jgi:NAD(P)-dependent dehydrogenase (short-subunit alcohol dehydrogenase family)
MTINFKGRTAIITGGGAGLGRAHALALAERGANIIVNDLIGAELVASEIRKQGGAALASTADVTSETEVNAMVQLGISKFKKIDILVNNAGILRDKSFAKMEIVDFKKVLDVHLLGSTICTKAVWSSMRDNGYGRIVFTTSASGLYGNFGQANYGSAKTGLLGLMNVLQTEGEKYNLRVNMLAPTAATQMTEGLIPKDAIELLQPETITPGLLWLVSEEGPKRMILAAGAGCFAQTRIFETRGICLEGDDLTPENIAKNSEQISNMEGAMELKDAFTQTRQFYERSAAKKGIPATWK